MRRIPLPNGATRVPSNLVGQVKTYRDKSDVRVIAHGPWETVMAHHDFEVVNPFNGSTIQVIGNLYKVDIDTRRQTIYVLQRGERLLWQFNEVVEKMFS